MLDVEAWAEMRRMHAVEGLSIKEIARRTGAARNTVRVALRSDGPPGYKRPQRPSKLDPFKCRIEEILREDPKTPARRIQEVVAADGYEGSKTILCDWLREIRPHHLPQRTFQKTDYVPGEILQFDLMQPRTEIPVGHGQTRKAWVVTAALGYSRVGAGALVFSRKAPDLIWGMSRCISSLGALPERVV